ncbi:MAG: anion permease [Acidobacteria bacterium]|nr:anion permease [Acidobacteriota bacterium]MYJ03497.1 anion permease [Acidobacteriota bacterium]
MGGAALTSIGRAPRVDATRLALVALVGALLWLIPVPEGVQPRAWQLLAIFVATMVGIVMRPMPMGALAFVSVSFAVLSGTLTIGEATAGFGNTVVWLVVAAFFIATAFVKTGLGTRIAYHFMRLLGKRSLGLAYGFVATDLFLAPAIPSNTARAGAVIFPIVKSLCVSLGSDAALGTQRRIAGFLTFTAYQGVVITSAMFLTAMAANPLAAELAAQQGVEISWALWAMAGFVPGVLSLLVVPLLIYRLYPPEITRTPEAPELARERLREMGAMSRDEWVLLAVFFLLLTLWIFGGVLGVNATATALAGVAAMLATGALAWDDILNERNGWNTLIWFAVLVMMASQLGELGLLDWFTERVSGVLGERHWLPAFLSLSLIYFYVHYFFASNTAHVSAMYAPFLALAIVVGTPPVLAALVLAFFSNLFASMTHYGTAPAPILFGSGNVDIGTWWKLGALISVVNIAIWLGAGSLWWRLLGLW